MNKRFKSVYRLCLTLSNLIYLVTLHFPKDMKYTEGTLLRSQCTHLVSHCLSMLRSLDEEQELRHRQLLLQTLINIEALCAIINDVKRPIKFKKGGQRWERLINPTNDAKIQSIIIDIQDNLK